MNTEELARQIGDNLNDIMRRDGWSKQDLVNDTGLSDKTILNYIQGKTVPYGYNIWLICDALKISSRELLGF